MTYDEYIAQEQQAMDEEQREDSCFLEYQPEGQFVRGGCCPIGMKKMFPSYIDETCLLHEKIYVSAGQRGMQLRLTPQDLINYVPLVVCDLI